jgi:hypothetical protein
MSTAVETTADGERFDLRGRLGAGGMGTVYRAFDRRLGREVALKILRQASGRDLFRFKREFRALADIVHPNLAALHELHTTGDEWFFTMDLVEGVDFLAWVRRAPALDGDDEAADGVTADVPIRAVEPTPAEIAPARPPVDFARLEDAFGQLVEGVLALHVAGKLHRDLKPSNVLVTPEGRVVLLDFGLIASVGEGDLTHEHAAVGTPAYMAPEQAADFPLDQACDWYAVGVMLYEALTGRRPFQGSAEDVMRRKQVDRPTPPSVIEPGVPRGLEALCLRLLAVMPAERPDGRAILAALGRAPARATQDLARAQAAAPFVGRVPELAALRAAFEASRQRGVAVFVRGESGMGKSQLIRELLDGLAGGAQILEGRCYERERVPFKTLDTVIDALTGVLLALPAARLEAVLPRDIAALARLFPVLRRVDAVAGRVLGAILPSDPADVRRRAFAALRVLLRGLTAIAPVVIAIDDLQWGDADSAAFLAELIHHPEPVPLLLVLVHRTDHDGGEDGVVATVRTPRAGIRPGDTRVVDVGPLGADEARELIRALGGDGADALVREGGGHPLFLAELARGGGDGGAVTSLEQLITRRIAGLPAGAAALLRTVAVAARPVPVELAARAAGLTAIGSEVALLRAERLLRVRAGDGAEATIEPYHDRIRAAAVASLGAALPAAHEALALAFESSAGRGDLEGVVEHWLAAGQAARAAAFAVRAGAAAEETLAFDRAAELYALAVQHGTASADEKRGLLRRRAEALTNAGALEAAADAYGAAAVGAPADEALDLERLRMEQVLRRGRMEEGVALARALLARVGTRLPLRGRAVLPALLVERLRLRLRGMRHQVRAEADVAPVLLQRIDVLGSAAGGLAFVAPAAGTLLQARLLRLALDAGEPRRLIVALGMELAFVGTAGARVAKRVEALATQLRQVLGDSQDPGLVGFATCCEGLALFLAGRWRDARRCMEAGLKLRDQGIGKRWEINVAELYVTSAMYYLGETRELARMVPLLLRDAVERGDVYAQHGLRGWRSNVAWLVMDRASEARAHVDAVARERPAREGFHLQHYYELLAQAQIDLYEGDPAAAWRRVEAAWRPLSRSFLLRIQSVRIEASFLRARVALAQGGPRGIAIAKAALRALEREGAPWASAHALQLRAGVLLARGQREAAEDALAAAERACATCDMALHAAVLRLRRGELHGGVAGAAWAAEARAAMAAQAIVDPDAMARMLCPASTRLLPGE